VWGGDVSWGRGWTCNGALDTRIVGSVSRMLSGAGMLNCLGQNPA